MACVLCHCPCFPSDWACLMQYAPELKPISIDKIEVAIGRARLQYLSPLFGPKCLNELCTAIADARAAAIINHTDWKDELPQKWKIVVQSPDFQTAYANAVYREYVTANAATATNDGIVQIVRDSTNTSQTIDTSTKHVDRNLRNDILNDLTKLISQAQQLFVEYVIKPNIGLYDCSPSCCPCEKVVSSCATTCNACEDGSYQQVPYSKARKLNFVK